MKYAFIVGEGDLVLQTIAVAKHKKLDFVIAGINGVSRAKIVNSHEHFWFYLGKVGSLLDNLTKHKVTHIVLLGAVKRPSLFALRADSLGLKIIKQYLQGTFGDDSLLRNIIELFAQYDFAVVGVQEIDENIFVKQGYLTQTKALSENENDINNGFKFAKEFSAFDVGQSIIYQQNTVVSIEAKEGTANLIKRSKKLISKTNPGALLIKVKKINQDDRVDLPAIGTKTIKQCKNSNVSGIVIEANCTIVINKQETIWLADKYKIFILAI